MSSGLGTPGMKGTRGRVICAVEVRGMTIDDVNKNVWHKVGQKYDQNGGGM